MVEQRAVMSIDQLLDLGTASNNFLDLYIYVDDEIKPLPWPDVVSLQRFKWFHATWTVYKSLVAPWIGPIFRDLTS